MKKLLVILLLMFSLWFGLRNVLPMSGIQSNNEVSYVFDDDDDYIPIVLA